MSAPLGHSFPASQALQLITLVGRFGVTAEELLEGSGLVEAELDLPQVRLSTQTLTSLSERARRLTGEPGIGFYLGLQKRLTMYGFVGFAAMSASTLREAIALFVRFSPAVSTALTLDLLVNGDTATLSMEEHVDLGSAHDIALFSLLVGMRTLTSAMTGRESGAGSTDIPLARPDYFERFAHLLPNARFDMPRAAFHFSASDLDLPLVAPDRAALRLARDECERQLSALGFDRTLAARVRKLAVTAEGFRRIDDVARELHISTRTLKRRLTEEGVSYTEVIDRERHARAQELLRDADLTLEDIAHRLDYSTLANFVRAFRRWTSETPAQYRKRIRAGL